MAYLLTLQLYVAGIASFLQAAPILFRANSAIRKNLEFCGREGDPSYPTNFQTALEEQFLKNMQPTGACDALVPRQLII